MSLRGLTDYIYFINLPETGPYTSGEDFFKYFWDTEAGNLYLSANRKIEQEWIAAGRLTIELSLTNNNYHGVASFTFASKADGDEYEGRNTEVTTQYVDNGYSSAPISDAQIVEQVVSAEDPLNYQSKIESTLDSYGIETKKYITPTGLKVDSIGEMILAYFNIENHDHI